MKNITTLFLLICTCLILNAQDRKHIDSIYIYEKDEAAEWILLEKINHQYDAEGNYEGNIVSKWEEDQALFSKKRQSNLIYDKKDKRVRVQKVWDTDSQSWQDDQQFVVKYDSKGRKIETINQYSADGMWKDHYSKKIVLDKKGNVTEQLTKVMDKTGEGKNVIDRKLFIHKDGKLVERLEQNKSELSAEWTNKKRYIYIYDKDGNIQKGVEQFWDLDKNNWGVSFNESYVYNKDGQLSQVNTSFVNATVKAGTKRGKKTLYSHNREGSILSKEVQHWNNQNKAYVRTSLKWYNYNEDGKLIEEGFQRWDKQSRDLYDGSKTTYKFDGRKKLSYISQSWNVETNAWENVIVQEFVYNEEDYQTEAYFSQWNFETKDLLYNKKFERFWSEVKATEEVAKKETEEDEIKISDSECSIPNPYTAGNSIYCSGLEMETDYYLLVHDMSGKLLHRKTFRGSDPVSVNEQLPAGIYIFKIQSPEKMVSSHKVVVQ